MNNEVNTVLNLIENLDYNKCIENSFKNYHVSDLTYINLLRTDKLTIKLYFIPSDIKTNSEGFLVWPHNHRYNFNTTVLYGEITNVIFTKTYGIEKYKCFDYFNNSTDKFTFKEDTKLRVSSLLDYVKGQSYYLTTNQIHTLIPSANLNTCLLLYQFENKLFNGTQFYTKDNNLPEDSEIYEKLTKDEIENYLYILRSRL